MLPPSGTGGFFFFGGAQLAACSLKGFQSSTTGGGLSWRYWAPNEPGPYSVGVWGPDSSIRFSTLMGTCETVEEARWGAGCPPLEGPAGPESPPESVSRW